MTDLAIPEPVVCTICGEVCYNSCRKGRTEQPGSEMRPCHVRVSEPFPSRKG